MNIKHARALGAAYDAWAVGKDYEHRCDTGFYEFTKEYLGWPVAICWLPDTLAEMNWGAFIPFESDGKKWFDIFVHRSLTREDERLVVIKELFHVHYDTPEERLTTMDVLAHVQSIAIPLSTGQPMPSDRSVSNEFDTFFAATEFIFPHADRVALLASGAPIDVPTLVAKYRLDGGLIKLLLEDWAIEAFDPDLDGKDADSDLSAPLVD